MTMMHPPCSLRQRGVVNRGDLRGRKTNNRPRTRQDDRVVVSTGLPGVNGTAAGIFLGFLDSEARVLFYDKEEEEIRSWGF